MRKLVRNPGKFFEDFAKNRSNASSRNQNPEAGVALERIEVLLKELQKDSRTIAKGVKQVQSAIDANTNLQLRSHLAPHLAKPYHSALHDICCRTKGSEDTRNIQHFVGRYMSNLDSLNDDVYARLDEEDRETFMRWSLKRYAKIDLLRAGELDEYERKVVEIGKIPVDQTFSYRGRNFRVKNLKSLGYDLPFIQTSDLVLMNDFYLDQYSHKEVFVREGDVVIDAGAYTGDTAVVFGSNTNWNVEVHSFELSQANIDCFEANLELNPQLKNKVTINRLALTERAGDTVYFDEGNHEDQVFSAFRIGASEHGVAVPTTTIDKYISDRKIDKLDFIKMDIEGAERSALAGAREAIAKHKPRLAISYYHLWDDLFVIPRLIHELHSDYVFFFNWYNKRLLNEAVLYAIDRSELQRIQDADH